MRRFFLGGALVTMSALPFALGHVEARGNQSGAGAATATSTAVASTVRTLARGVHAGGLAADAAERVYFTANDRVYRISGNLKTASNGRASADGGLAIVAGNGERGSLGDGGPANLAQLDLGPANGNLAADLAGNLFLADILNDTVRRVDAESQVISSVAGRWATGPGAAISSRGVVRPDLLAVDASGDLFIAGNNAVSRLDSAGGFSQIASAINPAAIAVSRDGTSVAVAVDGGNTIVFFERQESGNYQTAFTWPPSHGGDVLVAEGPASTTGGSKVREGASAIRFEFSGLAIDASGRLFIANRTVSSIERLDTKTSQIETVAGDGRSGYAGDGGPPLAAEFDAPGAMTIDRDGNLLLADTGNLAVREITHVAAVAGVTLTPNTFAFPNEPTGGASAPEVFTLMNNSAVQVAGISIDFTGGSTPPDFSETSTCATTLDPGGSCAISVIFMPQAAGSRSAALHVSDSDPSSPQTAALSGFADDYELQLQSGSTDTLTIVTGAQANYNLIVVPDETFSGTVTIECPVNLPTDMACGMATGTAMSQSGLPTGMLGPMSLPLTVAPGVPQNFFMSMSTMVKGQSEIGSDRRHWPRVPAPGVEILVLAAIAAIYCLERLRRNVRWLTAGLGLGVMVVIAAVGCGGGSSTTLLTTQNPGTPAGTYHFNVRADSQGASRAFTVTLIVQLP